MFEKILNVKNWRLFDNTAAQGGKKGQYKMTIKI